MSGSSKEMEVLAQNPQLAEMLKTPEGQQMAAMLMSKRASSSQGQMSPYEKMSGMAMQKYAQQQNQLIAPPSLRPKVTQGQQINIMSPYEELMKLQQLQQMRQRPQSLL